MKQLKDDIPYEETRYGFVYGAATVERVTHDKGRVIISVITPRENFEFMVTKSGLIRLYPVQKKEK